MPSLSQPPPSADTDESAPQASRVLRFGSTVALALLGAFVASLPAASRTWDVSGSWLVLASLELVPLALAMVLFRQARVGLRSFAGPGAAERSLAVAVWLLASTLVLALVGAVLRATTHHHPLAGVTFALVACIAAVLLVPTSVRIVDIALGWLRSGARARLVAAFVMTGTIVGLVVLRLVHAVPAEATLSPTASATVIDLSAFALVAFLASLPDVSNRRLLALIGPPAAVALLAVGVPRLTGGGSVAPVIEERGPLFSPIVELARSR